MKLTIPSFTYVPNITQDWVEFPANLFIPVGEHHVTITGTANPATGDTWQVHFGPNWDQPGGPNISASTLQWILLAGGGSIGDGLPIANNPPVMETYSGKLGPQPFAYTGTVTVTSEGALRLVASSAGPDPAKTTTFRDVIIEVTPL